MRANFLMHQYVVGPSPDKLVAEPVRVANHQVNIELQPGDFAD